MARMRSVKPEFWSDQDLAKLPREIRLFYIALWNFADEQARMPGDPRLVKAWCFPLDDDLTADAIEKWLSVLEDAGKVEKYSDGSSLYLYLTRLSDHQKLDPRLDSRHPAPPSQCLNTGSHQRIGVDHGRTGVDGQSGHLPADTDEPEIDTDQSVRTGGETPTAHRPEGAKHVAGSMEHVAGGAHTDTSVRGASTTQKGTRLPEDWKPTADDVAWARGEHYPDDWVRRETEKFRNYFAAVPGVKGRKVRWSAAWKNWIMKGADDANLGNGARPARAADPVWSRKFDHDR